MQTLSRPYGSVPGRIAVKNPAIRFRYLHYVIKIGVCQHLLIPISSRFLSRKGSVGFIIKSIKSELIYYLSVISFDLLK